MAALVAACSDAPRLAPPPDLDPDVVAPPEPQIFAAGTVSWGAGPDNSFDWEIEEILGFIDSVTLTATTGALISVRSISPESAQDPLWMGSVTVIDDGPPIVFGGVGEDVDRLILVNGDGEELGVRLVELTTRDWSLAVQELPQDWADGELSAVAAVASTGGREIARETVSGLN